MPTDGKVTLVGYSSPRSGSAGRWDATHYTLGDKVNKVVFLAPLFMAANGAQQPREEPTTGPFPTFPLTLYDRTAAEGGWNLASDQDTCGDLVIPGTEASCGSRASPRTRSVRPGEARWLARRPA